MGLATGGQWEGSYIGNELDGFDMWKSITSGSDSPRSEIVHYHDGDSTYTITAKGFKLSKGTEPPGVVEPSWIFDKDQDPDAADMSCENPSLMYSDDYDSPMAAGKPSGTSSSSSSYSRASQETVSNGRWSTPGLVLTCFFAVVGTITMFILLQITLQRKRKYDAMRAAMSSSADKQAADQVHSRDDETAHLLLKA
jgi:hypothetical protein